MKKYLTVILPGLAWLVLFADAAKISDLSEATSGLASTDEVIVNEYGANPVTRRATLLAALDAMIEGDSTAYGRALLELSDAAGLRDAAGLEGTGGNSTIGGGRENTASGNFSTVSGGTLNTASGIHTTVSGGRDNTAYGNYSTISGGRENTASGFLATVSGGDENEASEESSTVSGGIRNTASGESSTVSGGEDNTASGAYSTVSGGGNNTASGSAATISGGAANIASEDYSYARGLKAKAIHQGAHVATDSQNADQESTATDQMTWRFQGGYRLLDGAVSAPDATSVDGDSLLNRDAMDGRYIQDDQPLAWDGFGARAGIQASGTDHGLIVRNSITGGNAIIGWSVSGSSGVKAIQQDHASSPAVNVYREVDMITTASDAAAYHVFQSGRAPVFSAQGGYGNPDYAVYANQDDGYRVDLDGETVDRGRVGFAAAVATTTTSEGWQTQSFSTEIDDTHDAWDGTTFVAPYSGVYRVSAMWAAENFPADEQLLVSVWDGTVTTLLGRQHSSVTGIMGAGGSAVVSLDAGDTLVLRVQALGVGTTISPSTGAASQYQTFSVYLQN